MRSIFIEEKIDIKELVEEKFVSKIDGKILKN